jgi:hypothetical protein
MVASDQIIAFRNQIGNGVKLAPADWMVKAESDLTCYLWEIRRFPTLSWQAFASAEIVLALNNAASATRARRGRVTG